MAKYPIFSPKVKSVFPSFESDSKDSAETRRFELLKALTPYLVSSEAHSTGLCDVSELQVKFSASALPYLTPK